MNYIEQFVAANEELSIAIEDYNMAHKAPIFKGLSAAMEETAEDVKEVKKTGVIAKIKALIVRLIQWFKDKYEGLKERRKKNDDKSENALRNRFDEKKVGAFLKTHSDNAAAGDEQSTALLKAFKEIRSNPKAWLQHTADYSVTIAGYGDLDLAKKYIDSMMSLFDRLKEMRNKFNGDGLDAIVGEFNQLHDKFNADINPRRGAELFLEKDWGAKFSKITDSVNFSVLDGVVKDLDAIKNKDYEGDPQAVQKFILAVTKALSCAYSFENWYLELDSDRYLRSYFTRNQFGISDNDQLHYCIHIATGDPEYSKVYESIIK